MSEPTLHAVVVTDDAQLRDELRGGLEEEGFFVATPATGREATEVVCAGRSQPCLVIVDFTTHGVDVARMKSGLKSGDLLLTVPVLMTFGGKQPMDVEDVFDCARLFKDEGSDAVADRGQAQRAVWRHLADRPRDDASRNGPRLGRDDTPRR